MSSLVKPTAAEALLRAVPAKPSGPAPRRKSPSPRAGAPIRIDIDIHFHELVTYPRIPARRRRLDRSCSRAPTRSRGGGGPAAFLIARPGAAGHPRPRADAGRSHRVRRDKTRRRRRGRRRRHRSGHGAGDTGGDGARLRRTGGANRRRCAGGGGQGSALRPPATPDQPRRSARRAEFRPARPLPRRRRSTRWVAISGSAYSSGKALRNSRRAPLHRTPVPRCPPIMGHSLGRILFDQCRGPGKQSALFPGIG